MYKDFYNFKENPFSITADPEYFFSSSKHMEAFSHLIYGIQERKGILVITGEIGTGKTTLCKTLLNKLDTNVKTAFILNPYFSEIQLLQLIVNDLGIETDYKKNRLSLVEAINKYLIDESINGNNVVLIIDEAQNLKVSQLEQVRLLSNLETEKDKLLQILLVGQPELMNKLKLESLRQVNQRIAVRYHIMPLDKVEVNDYINHRLKVASYEYNGNPAVKFTEEALEAIYLRSQGTPRLINVLCDRSLLAGFAAEAREITKQMVINSAREIG